MKRIAIALAATCLAQPCSAQTGQFIGNLVFTDPACTETKYCVLKEAYSFQAADGTGWEAKADLRTDGATIPAWAQAFVGKPFTPAYLKAAVIHDHYCDRHVRDWRSTHRVFYDALIASGVDQPTAALLYFGVYLGGPKWAKLIEGMPCSNLKQGCVNKQPKLSWFRDYAVQPGEAKGEYVVVRDATYEKPDFAPAMKKAEALVRSKGQVTLAELEQLASDTRPDDAFLITSTSMIANDGPDPKVGLGGWSP